MTSTIEIPKPIQCQKCGNDFICRADDIQNCHCSAVRLNPEQRQMISQKWQDCLCRKCLVEIAGSDQKSANSNL